jgi:hypothetical protein
VIILGSYPHLSIAAVCGIRCYLPLSGPVEQSIQSYDRLPAALVGILSKPRHELWFLSPLQLSTLHDLYGMQIILIAFWEIRFTQRCTEIQFFVSQILFAAPALPYLHQTSSSTAGICDNF